MIDHMQVVLHPEDFFDLASQAEESRHAGSAWRRQILKFLLPPAPPSLSTSASARANSQRTIAACALFSVRRERRRHCTRAPIPRPPPAGRPRRQPPPNARGQASRAGWIHSGRRQRARRSGCSLVTVAAAAHSAARALGL